MIRVIVKYGIGYGRHEMDLEFDDDATEQQIENEVSGAVMECLDWSWSTVEKRS